MADGLLNSWKEISNYAQRGVRTVQRWEADFAFPVHRSSNHLRSSVFAFRDEIDAWFRTRWERSKPSPGTQAGTTANGPVVICPNCGSEIHGVAAPEARPRTDERSRRANTR